MVIEGKLVAPVKDACRPSPTPNVGKLASLKKYADRDYALDLLHQITRAVAPILHKYKFRVATLCEMFPKNPQLLGLNVNRGQKILVRLRAPHNDRCFLPINDLIGTLLHELVHNVHGPHDAKFYALLDELKTTLETRAYLTSDYVCEENRLGRKPVAPWAGYQSVRQKRLQALSRGTYKAESRRLGGKAPPLKDVKRLMWQAAERRLEDSKWCADAASGDVAGAPGVEELHSVGSSAGDELVLAHVVDLTTDEIDDDQVEIITIDP